MLEQQINRRMKSITEINQYVLLLLLLFLYFIIDIIIITINISHQYINFYK